MSTERRYREDEVREIFSLAARVGTREPSPISDADGLTLADIQDIGLEVGLERSVIARAATALDVRASRLPQRKSLGLPVQVGRIVPLPRPITDSEWEQLVAELRTTFGARGQVSTHGTLREWVNGNLHACIEPAENGHRLRLGTTKGDAAAINAVGLTGVVTGAVAFGALVMSGGLAEAVLVPWMISGSGVAALLANLLRLPPWARRREAQMEFIAARVASIMAGDPLPDDHQNDKESRVDQR